MKTDDDDDGGVDGDYDDDDGDDDNDDDDDDDDADDDDVHDADDERNLVEWSDIDTIFELRICKSFWLQWWHHLPTLTVCCGVASLSRSASICVHCHRSLSRASRCLLFVDGTNS